RAWGNRQRLPPPCSSRRQTSRSQRGPAAGRVPLQEPRGCGSCEGLVCAVAQGLFAGALAGAEPVVAGLRASVLHRRAAAALVGAVAERLVLALPAGAPPVVLACLQRYLDGRLCRDNRLGHVAFPVAAALLRCRAHPLLAESRQWSAGLQASGPHAA